MRMTRHIDEGATSPTYPLASQDLRFCNFALSANMQRETTFNKAKIVFRPLLLPCLPIPGPKKNSVAYKSDREERAPMGAALNAAVERQNN